MKLILFDLDATLLLTHGAGMRGMTRAGVELFGPKFSLEGVTIAGGLDTRIFEQAVNACETTVTDDRRAKFREAYYRCLDEELKTGQPAEALPGIPELLARLHADDGVIVGLLTGNFRHTGELKLRAAGLDPGVFAVSAWNDDASERTALVGVARSRHPHPLDPGDIIVVGDTPRDVECARVNGCVSFAVATGPYSVEQLRESGADHVVQDLGDPAPLIRLLR